ncbi:hypothetical protein PTKIN_Ptkin17bG0104600 [Pterospermum kingtungense]
MADEIEELLNKVSLVDSDDEEDVLIEVDWVDDSKKIKDFCLVGTMLIRKPYTLDAMRTTFIKAWQVSHALHIKEFSERLFHFASKMEKGKVFFLQPWTFNKSLMVMRALEDTDNIEDIDMDWCSFWVHCMVCV